MRCVIDTNVIISAGLFPKSIPALALEKSFSPPYSAIISDYTLNELNRVIDEKFPDKVPDYKLFLERLLPNIEQIITPVDIIEDEGKVRDFDDRPILRAAVAANADMIITGDKDLLESGIKSALSEYMFKAANKNIKIVQTALLYNAALIGAAAITLI